jgi:hypothetical protein
VDVDESDPLAFLDMPVGRSVFLVGDAGRVKEISSAVPPRQAEEMFAAEEAYVRRLSAEEQYMAELRDEFTRLESGSQGAMGISSFTVEGPAPEAVAARAHRLLGPIAQQLALLGPPGWDRFAAAFSFTVSGEVAELRFWSGGRSTEVRVPEQIALLVRRQRHLAAGMPAGPWWRLLLTVDQSAGPDARITTDYDYGDRPFPDDQLLAAEHYRDDLAAYPRAQTPAWLSAYVSGAEPASAARTEPSRQAAAPQPVLDTTVGRTPLHADPEVITYGRKSMVLDQVEWISFSATRIAEKRFMFPTFYDNKWDFRVGRYGGPEVTVRFSRAGRHAEQPTEWTFLVDLAGQYLVPRLLTELVTRVRGGETVTVGGGVSVSRDGIACGRPRLSLRWGSISTARLHNGSVWIYQAGVEKAVLTVPLSRPNAALIPDLFAALMA